MRNARSLRRFRAGLYERDEGRAADEQAVRREANAVPFVGREVALPENLGDDSEHRAAVQAKLGAAHDVELESAEPH